MIKNKKAIDKIKKWGINILLNILGAILWKTEISSRKLISI